MHLLIVDDSPIITKNIALYFEHTGYSCLQCHDGEAAYEALKTTHFDCIILDRMMPKLDGMGLARLLKTQKIQTPIIFLTALGKTIDRIEGLEIGADDYLVKPFDLEELRLRVVRSIGRGSSGETVSLSRQRDLLTTQTSLTYGPILVDLSRMKVSVEARSISLSPKEFDLLVFLLRNVGQIVSRDHIYESVWDADSSAMDSLDTVNVHMAYLRKKLGINIIHTIKLQGYVLEMV